jgi:two-component system nitrogen regulation response regulator GlnG
LRLGDPSARIVVQAPPGPGRDHACEIISGRGATPLPVSAPERVLASVASHEAPALVLLDLDLPDHQRALIPELREANPNLTLVGFSESGRKGSSFLSEGGDVALESPVDHQELVALVLPFVPPPPLQPQKLAPSLQPSPELEGLRDTAKRGTQFGLPLCILGETGVGKTVLARRIHEDSRRAGKPFVTVLCTAIPRHLLEAELFGYERGAFTGATKMKRGRFEVAAGGTIFLDEVGDLDLELQAKLLQVLDGGDYCRLGSNTERHADVQLITATSADLSARVEEGRFRLDLYERLHVIPLEISPLRERRHEIGPLLRGLLCYYSELLMRPIPEISPRLAGILQHHDFPGNIRELENIARRVVALQSDETTVIALLEQRSGAFMRSLGSLVSDAELAAGQEPLLDVANRVASEAERELITQALYRHGWNRRRASASLGVSYATMLRKMRELDVCEA